MNILIVDDEPNGRKTLSEILKTKGFEVEEAGTGSEAVALCKSRFFNLILIDIRLPDISGLEVLKSVREINEDTVSIIMTAYASIDSAIEAINEGAYSYITKPINWDKALATIKLALEKQRLKEALRISEANYRTIFESANDAIIIRDINTYRIVDANSKACEMFCYPREEMIGRDLETISVDSIQYSPKNLKSLYDNLSVEEPQHIFEWLIKDKFGREFWVEANIKKTIIGEKYRFLAIIRDITERKQLLKQKDDFMNMMSHELRTPLGAIKESISLVLDGVTGTINKKQQEVLSTGKRNVDRLTRLINQVLDFQKMVSGQIKFHFEKNDINSAIKEAHMSMISLATKKELKVNLNLDEGLPRVNFDRDKIIEVLINLLSNAIKYTEKGSITMTSSRQGNAIHISVKDTGSGIREEDISKLFKRFSQLERKPGSSGLGLAIAKEIIEAHKGKIWVESEFGKESTFHFLLPIEERRG